MNTNETLTALLCEARAFCNEINLFGARTGLPYSELITDDFKEDTSHDE